MKAKLGTNSRKFRLCRWEKNSPVTQEEAEAHLNREGYPSFCWYDVPGVVYPRHWHASDECIWILKGEAQFIIEDQSYLLKNSDRIYISAGLPHQVKVSLSTSVTYLVGRKK